jgi:hypothetical protein
MVEDQTMSRAAEEVPRDVSRAGARMTVLWCRVRSPVARTSAVRSEWLAGVSLALDAQAARTLVALFGELEGCTVAVLVLPRRAAVRLHEALVDERRQLLEGRAVDRRLVRMARLHVQGEGEKVLLAAPARAAQQLLQRAPAGFVAVAGLSTSRLVVLEQRDEHSSGGAAETARRRRRVGESGGIVVDLPHVLLGHVAHSLDDLARHVPARQSHLTNGQLRHPLAHALPRSLLVRGDVALLGELEQATDVQYALVGTVRARSCAHVRRGVHRLSATASTAGCSRARALQRAGTIPPTLGQPKCSSWGRAPPFRLRTEGVATRPEVVARSARAKWSRAACRTATMGGFGRYECLSRYPGHLGRRAC